MEQEHPLNSYKIPEWEYQIIPSKGIRLEWEIKGYLSMGTSGNGNVRKLPTLGSDWNGKLRVICPMGKSGNSLHGDHTGIGTKGLFPSTRNIFWRFLHPCKSPVPEKCLPGKVTHLALLCSPVSGILPLPLKRSISEDQEIQDENGALCAGKSIWIRGCCSQD